MTTAERRELSVTGDVTVSAVFAEDFVITASAGPGGSIAPAGDVTVTSGADQAFAITADAGYSVQDVAVDGVSQGPLSSYTFTGVAADHTIAATFAADTYDLAYVASAGGTISGPAAQTVAHGSDGASVTAVPDAGRHFVGWDDLVLTPERRDLAVTADATYTALFAADIVTRPDPPRTVVAYAIGAGEVLVNWERSAGTSGAVSYNVWRSADGVTYEEVASVAGADTFSFRDANAYVASSTRFYYAVSIVDDRGESDLSAPSTAAETKTGAPVAPSPVSAIEGSGTVALVWARPLGPSIVGYRVYRGDRSMAATRTLLTASPIPSTDATASYTDAGVQNGRDYWYVVTSVDAAGVESDVTIEQMGTPNAVFPDSPHGPAGALQRGCEKCHVSHNTAQPVLQIGLCVDCHDGSAGEDVASRVDSTAVGSQHAVDSSSTASALKCGSCHGGHQRASVANGMMLDVEGESAGNAACLGSCHGPASSLPSGDLSGFAGSSHDVALPGYSAAQINCVNCHDQHGTSNASLLRYETTTSCLQCHADAGPAPSVQQILDPNTDPKTRHPLTAEDQALTGGRIGCENCHNPHIATSDHALVDPDDPAPVAYTGSSTDFCLRCHDGALPTAQQTGRWAQAPLASGGAGSTPVDIAVAWQTDAHGAATSTSPNLRLHAPMGYEAGVSLACDTCHDPHGSSGPYSLRETVASANGSHSHENVLAEPILDAQQHAVGYDLRFFCQSCHELTPENHVWADISAYPTDCTGCHKHGSSAF